MSDTGASFGGRKTFSGAGGTPGGVGEFLIGLVLLGIGIYLIFERITVHTSFFQLSSGRSAFGLTLLVALIGLGMLFFNGRSVLGWLLFAGGLAVIVVGVVINLDVYFQSTSLWGALIIFGLPAAGLGLLARSLRPHGSKRTELPGG